MIYDPLHPPSTVHFAFVPFPDIQCSPVADVEAHGCRDRHGDRLRQRRHRFPRTDVWLQRHVISFRPRVSLRRIPTPKIVRLVHRAIPLLRRLETIIHPRCTHRSWAVRGCLKWQAEGLAELVVIRKATRRWYRPATFKHGQLI